MAYAMIWLESLAGAILLAAVVTALAARLRRAWVRIALAAAGAILPTAVGGLAAFLCAWLAVVTLRTWYAFGWFHYWFWWTVLAAGGAAAVVIIGLRRRGEGARPAAAWPRGKLVVSLAAVGVLGFITFWNQDLAVKGRLASLRAEAGAMALSAAPARPRDADNAAPLYRQAFEAMLKGEDLPPEFHEKWLACISDDQAERKPFDPSDAKLAAFLDRNEAAMALLRRGAAMPACFFDHDYGRPSINIALPELTHVQAAARLLALDACASGARGRGDRAAADIRAILGLARHEQEEPLVISLLVAVSVHDMGVRTLEAVLSASPPPPAQLAAIDLGEDGSFQRALPRAFLMEEAFVLATVADIALTDDLAAVRHLEAGDSGCVAAVFLPLWRVFFMQDEVAAYRQGMHEYQRLAAQPFREAQAGWKEAADQKRIRSRGILASVAMPAYSRLVEVVAAGDARQAVARCGVAAARFRADKGAWPPDPAALVPQYLPAVPRDPFDGKPVRMAARGAGAVFYSVGRDLADDGGAPYDRQEQAGDITFTLGRGE